MKRNLNEQLEDFIYKYDINSSYLYAVSDIKPVGNSTYQNEIKYDFLVTDKADKNKKIVKMLPYCVIPCIINIPPSVSFYQSFH